MRNIGSLVKKTREEKDIKQDEMACHLGISQGTYSELESGKSKIAMDRLEKIADKLNCQLEDFLPLREGITVKFRDTVSNDTSTNGFVIHEAPSIDPDAAKQVENSLRAHIKSLETQLEISNRQLEVSNRLLEQANQTIAALLGKK